MPPSTTPKPWRQRGLRVKLKIVPDPTKSALLKACTGLQCVDGDGISKSGYVFLRGSGRLPVFLSPTTTAPLFRNLQAAPLARKWEVPVDMTMRTSFLSSQIIELLYQGVFEAKRGGKAEIQPPAGGACPAGWRPMPRRCDTRPPPMQVQRFALHMTAKDRGPDHTSAGASSCPNSERGVQEPHQQSPKCVGHCMPRRRFGGWRPLCAGSPQSGEPLSYSRRR